MRWKKFKLWKGYKWSAWKVLSRSLSFAVRYEKWPARIPLSLRQFFNRSQKCGFRELVTILDRFLLLKIVDFGVAALLVHLLGWHWEFLPSFLAKLVPGVDLVPFWTLAVATVYRKSKLLAVAAEESREQHPALRDPHIPEPCELPVRFPSPSVITELVAQGRYLKQLRTFGIVRPRIPGASLPVFVTARPVVRPCARPK